MIHHILYGEGAQTITHVPPVRVSSATYVIEDLWVDDGDASRVLASGSATLDSVSASVDVASGRSQGDHYKVSIDGTTGFSIGGRYWLSENSQGETIEAAQIKTDDYLKSKHDLLGDYTTAATLQGMELTASFPSATANDEDVLIEQRKFRVVWEYTINGVKTKPQEQIQLVRYDQADLDVADALNIARTIFPDLDGLVRSKSQTLENWAAMAARLLRGQLLQRLNGQTPEEFLMGPRGAEAVAFKLMVIAAQNGFSPGDVVPADFLAEMRNELNGVWESMTRNRAGQETVDLTRSGDQATGAESKAFRPMNFLGL